MQTVRPIGLLACLFMLLTLGAAPEPDDSLWYGYRLGAALPAGVGGPASVTPRPWDNMNVVVVRGVVRRLQFDTVKESGDAVAFATDRIAELTRRFGPPTMIGYQSASWSFSDPAHPERQVRKLGVTGRLIAADVMPRSSAGRSNARIEAIKVVAVGPSVSMYIADHEPYEPPPLPPSVEHPLVADLSRHASCPVDYPASALRAEESGVAGLDVTIDATGAMTRCAVTVGTGSAALDDRSCAAFRCNVEGRRAAGTPLPVGRSTQRMRWQIP